MQVEVIFFFDFLAYLAMGSVHRVNWKRRWLEILALVRRDLADQSRHLDLLPLLLDHLLMFHELLCFSLLQSFVGVQVIGYLLL